VAAIPRAVLSDAFEGHLEGRRLRAGVFLTFQFEPDFFEQEVLPVLLGVSVSNERATLRLVQLEEALRSVEHLAVYYDPRALEGQSSAKLDVRRIPVLWPKGRFHPKNVLLLLEDAEPPAEDGSERRPDLLLFATMSANLTRHGWWENLEVAHIEAVEAGARCSFRDNILRLLERVKAASPPGTDHGALESVRKVVRGLDQRKHTSVDGELHPQFYVGNEPVGEFLGKMLGQNTSCLNLEVISPYFDQAGSAKPLIELKERLEPREVRVFLPRGNDGRALCGEEFYRRVKKMEGVGWGRLPQDLLRRGSGDAAAARGVHAKVYRFFDPNRRYEALFVGSVNLTNAAHSGEENLETGILMETNPKEVPEWWLAVDGSKPERFEERPEEDEGAPGPGVALSVRYSWDTGKAEAFWDRKHASARLQIEAQGSLLFELSRMPPQEWRRLPEEDARRLGEVLQSTAFLTVRVEGKNDALILVQEEGMAHKPSLLLSLSAADILRLWALLRPEQRSLLLEQRMEEILAAARKAGVEVGPVETAPRGMFDTFAGIFHSFGCLERGVLAALEGGRDREARYRLLGQKYDSLPRLLDQVSVEEKGIDPVERYLILLCARQVLDRVEEEAREFVARHRGEVKALRQRLDRLEEARAAIPFEGPEERGAFFGWYEEWFLKRAAPLEERA